MRRWHLIDRSLWLDQPIEIVRSPRSRIDATFFVSMGANTLHADSNARAMYANTIAHVESGKNGDEAKMRVAAMPTVSHSARVDFEGHSQ